MNSKHVTIKALSEYGGSFLICNLTYFKSTYYPLVYDNMYCSMLIATFQNKEVCNVFVLNIGIQVPSNTD